ncbi:hypothetical protein GUITHDRAFT_121447 [Guillardia theta CCMP2712]|uniref:MalT-like TPR region domain-containing protein n=1 Tax=Guillardia theta (strain CCMP2712) TaxID=905079 RepID=L1I815_GUITC|nr:hypothetical protein GUITHDRAFT_121447 [Guillardia theta CCMP2712]EKX32396.1 hypothetical protein GUITHDRAFT_121447 [Guillardia theta CCMP2712]|eukprot:XP_005819376.1 hypothetical protein GUITHDRAFT_121447 [Guillardia theta CCMP2712]
MLGLSMKEREDVKVADAEDVKVADAKDAEDVKVADAKDAEDVKVADAKDAEDVKVADAKDAEDVKVADAKDAEDVKVADAKDAEDGMSSGEERASGDESDAEEEDSREQDYKRKYQEAVKKLGLDHDKTLMKALRLVSCYIGRYKLNDTNEVLDEIMSLCKSRGGKFYIKAIQSRAFCYFKQYRFKEALELFHEQANLVGPSSALYENMAHTYNSIGDYDNAASYFSKAMELLGQGSYGKKGGILLGLGLVKERQGNPREALPILQEALDSYKAEYKSEDATSLIAKAHMSVGQCHELLGELKEAQSHIRDAVSIFRKTVGDSSPLTANALGVLGRILVAQDRREEAEPLLLEALELEACKDAFHPDTVWRLLNQLKELWTEGGSNIGIAALNSKCRRYVPVIERCDVRICELKLDQATPVAPFKADLGTIAVIYKTAGELVMLAGLYEQAKPLLRKALSLLERIPDFDCSVLIQSCVSSLRFLEDVAR